MESDVTDLGWDFFQKCFGDPNQVRRSETEAVVKTIERRELKCNGDLGIMQELANEVVAAAQLLV